MTNILTTINTATLTPTFDDEFNSFSASSTGSATTWMTEYPFWGSQRTLAYTHEAEYVSDSSVGVNPFKLTNGVLSITATPAAPGSNPLNLPYNSGAITTYRSFAQLYGYFEVRAELPAGQGLWPAFWMMPVNGQPGTEIDIFEVLGNSPTTLHATTHSGDKGFGQSQAVPIANASTGFHTYGVDWEPATVTFYVDGKAVASTPTPPDMDVPMYMLLSLAVGGKGSWPGPTNSTTPFPATMQIDDVRAYATAATVGATDPAPPQPTAGLALAQTTAAKGTGSVQVSVKHIGILDPGSLQAGVGVVLLNASGQVVSTATTDHTGTATFTGLAGGTYQVRYVPPANLTLQPGSQANTATGLTAQFKLGSGQKLSLIHETVLSLAYLGGSVMVGKAADPGVVVSLLDASKTVLQTATTNSHGGFGFYAPAGTYSVHYTPPTGQTLAAGSHADPVSGISPPITLTSAQSFLLTPEMLVQTVPSHTGGGGGGGQIGTTPITSTTALGGASAAALQFIADTSSTGDIVASAGPESFDFTSAAAGQHDITGFNPLIDTIALSKAAFPSYAAVQAAETRGDGGTAIALASGSRLLIEGVAPRQLHSSNFLLS